jgi:hypothetical protein
MESLLIKVETKFKALRPLASMEDLEALRCSVREALRGVFLQEIGRHVKAENISAILSAQDEDESDD